MNFNFAGIANKQIQTTDVKVMAKLITIGTDAMSLLGLTGDNSSRIFIDKDLSSNKFWIAGIPVQRDENDKVITPGRPINSQGKFGNARLNYELGGHYTEYKILRDEVVENNGIKYYPLEMTVDGKVKAEQMKNEFDSVVNGEEEEFVDPAQTDMFEEVEEEQLGQSPVMEEEFTGSSQESVVVEPAHEHKAVETTEDVFASMESTTPAQDAAAARAEMLANFDSEEII